ncbi:MULTISPECIES: TetR/AcrR family transcriptional regulator [Streptacidiphilus]|uniref:TetR/AcrR family transcriptional regulator n=1 Tax=Streptacidiphilus cavernicola TaxID=3342716 RepID=A0ABV6URG0_9ACTN|nr:TetR/AcrR family transcriptional regulator [Streptacidiphilus jeojiense]
MNKTTPAPQGRPRSESAHRAILDAAVGLAVRDGYTAVTIKGIAEAAGVGRQTVYRWWPTRGAVLLEALGEIGAAHVLPEPSGDPRADLRRFLDQTFELAAEVPVANVLLGITADAVSDPGLAADRRGYISGRRDLLRQALERCGDTWAVPVDTLVDLAFGAMWYRLMNEHAAVGPQLTEELMVVVDALAR